MEEDYIEKNEQKAIGLEKQARGRRIPAPPRWENLPPGKRSSLLRGSYSSDKRAAQQYALAAAYRILADQDEFAATDLDYVKKLVSESQLDEIWKYVEKETRPGPKDSGVDLEYYSKIFAKKKQARGRKASHLSTPYSRLMEQQRHAARMAENAQSQTSSKKDNLESMATGLSAIIAFAAALFSISLKLTGNVVGSSSMSSNIISVCLFLLGCTLTVFYFRAKKK